MDKINLNTPLYDLRDKLKGVNLRPFEEEEVFCLKDLCRYNKTTLLRFRAIGNVTIHELSKLFDSYNIRFGMTEHEIEEYQKSFEGQSQTEVAPKEQQEPDKLWEQRRYELVKEQIVRLSFPCSKNQIEDAINVADNIIEALKGEI